MPTLRDWADIEAEARKKNPNVSQVDLDTWHAAWRDDARKKAAAAAVPEVPAETDEPPELLKRPKEETPGLYDRARRAYRAASEWERQNIEPALEKSPIGWALKGAAETTRAIEQPFEWAGEDITRALKPAERPIRHVAARAALAGGASKPQAKWLGRKAGESVYLPGGMVGFMPEAAALEYGVPELGLVPRPVRKLIEKAPRLGRELIDVATKGAAIQPITDLAKTVTGERQPMTPMDVARSVGSGAKQFVEYKLGEEALGLLGRGLRGGYRLGRRGLRRGADWWEGSTNRPETEGAGSTAGPTPPLRSDDSDDDGPGGGAPGGGETPDTHAKKEPADPGLAARNERTDRPGSGAGGTDPDDDGGGGGGGGGRARPSASVPPGVAPGDIAESDAVPDRGGAAMSSDQPKLKERGPVRTFVEERTRREHTFEIGEPEPELPRNIEEQRRRLRGIPYPRPEDEESRYEGLPRNLQEMLRRPEAFTAPAEPAAEPAAEPEGRSLGAQWALANILRQTPAETAPEPTVGPGATIEPRFGRKPLGPGTQREAAARALSDMLRQARADAEARGKAAPEAAAEPADTKAGAKTPADQKQTATAAETVAAAPKAAEAPKEGKPAEEKPAVTEGPTWKEGQRVKGTMASGKEITGTILEDHPGKNLVLLATDTSPNGIWFSRANLEPLTEAGEIEAEGRKTRAGTTTPDQDQLSRIVERLKAEMRSEADAEGKTKHWRDLRAELQRAQAALDEITGKPGGPKGATAGGRPDRGADKTVLGSTTEGAGRRWNQPWLKPGAAVRTTDGREGMVRSVSDETVTIDFPGGKVEEVGRGVVVAPEDDSIPPPTDPEGRGPGHAPVHGKEGTLHVEGYGPITFRYELVEARHVIASHKPDLSPNPQAKDELQGRDRDRAAMRDQVHEIRTEMNPDLLMDAPSAIEGAPLVGQDWHAEGGNGRTIAIQGMEPGEPGYERYIDRLAARAHEFGLKAEDVHDFEEPLLIRRRLTPIPDEERAAFAEATNAEAGATLSSGERAMADARKLTPGLLEHLALSERGNLNTEANLGFIRRFLQLVPKGQRNTLTTEGGFLSDEGLKRVQNAVLARAYTIGRTAHPALTRMFESGEGDVKTVQNALLRAAPHFAVYRGYVDAGELPMVDVMTKLLDGASTLADLRAKGFTIQDWLDQGEMGAPDVGLNRVMRLYQRYGNVRDLSDALRDVSDTLTNLPKQSEGQMFAPPETPSVTQVLDMALDPEEARRTKAQEDRTGAAVQKLEEEITQARAEKDYERATRLEEERDLLKRKKEEPC